MNNDLARIQNSQYITLFRPAPAFRRQNDPWQSLTDADGLILLERPKTDPDNGLAVMDLAGRRSLAGLRVLTNAEDNAEHEINVWAIYRIRPGRKFVNTQPGDIQEVFTARALGTIGTVASVAATSAFGTASGLNWITGGLTLYEPDEMVWTPSPFFAQLTAQYGTAAAVYNRGGAGPAVGRSEIAFTDLGDCEALLFDCWVDDEATARVQLLANLGY